MSEYIQLWRKWTKLRHWRLCAYLLSNSLRMEILAIFKSIFGFYTFNSHVLKMHAWIADVECFLLPGLPGLCAQAPVITTTPWIPGINLPLAPLTLQNDESFLPVQVPGSCTNTSDLTLANTPSTTWIIPWITPSKQIIWFLLVLRQEGLKKWRTPEIKLNRVLDSFMYHFSVSWFCRWMQRKIKLQFKWCIHNFNSFSVVRIVYNERSNFHSLKQE